MLITPLTTDLLYNGCKPMVFNGAKSRFCDLPDLRGDFSFHRDDFCGLESTKILNWFQI